MKSITQEKVNKAFSSFILSASGWRKVFVASGDEQDAGQEILAEDAYIVGQMTEVFCDFLDEKGFSSVVVAQDSRPTGQILASIACRVFASRRIAVCYLGVAATPEVLCYAKKIGSFFYLSASHNPIGHNGIKFGLNTGSVLDGTDVKSLIEKVRRHCSDEAFLPHMTTLLSDFPRLFCKADEVHKQASLAEYSDFVKSVVADSTNLEEVELFFETLKHNIQERVANGRPLILVSDFNGSARVASIDRAFFESLGFRMKTINENVGDIVHGIIPEGKNLQFCADFLTEVQQTAPKGADLLGYMPDCDGDRGNIVFWDAEKQKAVIPTAQEVFALSVVAELAFLAANKKNTQPVAVVVNDATSMRIDDIAKAFNATVFRAEVGEANQVALATKLREHGYTVRIFGEGSNGGSIIFPSGVRDPMNTILSILKLLTLVSTEKQKGLLEIYCEKIGVPYPKDSSLASILRILPLYTTTPTSVPKAQLKIAHINQGALKKAYQTLFETEWKKKQAQLTATYGITGYEVRANVGTTEICNLKNFAQSESGGLKILFYTNQEKPFAFMWMRKSGTEPIVRLIVDVKGDNTEAETFFSAWQLDILARAAEQAVQNNN